MKIERINDNQIRCTLTSLDLSSRGINLTELAYGSEKARNLFREMIQQAAKEVGFEAEDIPLMVEAIPLSSESIMFIVTNEAKAPQIQLRTFRFDSLDQVSEAAKAAGNSCDDIHNALYKKPSTRQYYLVLNNADCNELDFSRVCNVLAEYAAKLPNEYAKEAYYKEHYEVMIGEKALQKLKNL